MNKPSADSLSLAFGTALPSVFFVALIFFFNFISRVVSAPLMPVIQNDLGFTHAGAGYLFMAVALGNATGLLLSGFFSRAIHHRKTVGVSAILTGIMAMAAPLADSYVPLLFALYGLGTTAGLYLPSGIATITSLVRREDWGKAMAVHELAPNLSFVLAPLLAEAILLLAGWRSAYFAVGAVQACLGLWFLKRGRGGEYPGMVPNPALVLEIVRQPIFWLLVLFFSLAVGSSVGPYSMLPLYLVDEHGFGRAEANQLLAVSRVMACFVPFLAGWITDRWGPRPSILLFLLVTGSSLIALGLVSGKALVAVTLIQPLCTGFMFAPGFTLLSMVFPPDRRSVVVALMGPLNAVIGLGLVPAFLGNMGDAGLFDAGFVTLGCVILCAGLMLPRLPRGTAGQQPGASS